MGIKRRRTSSPGTIGEEKSKLFLIFKKVLLPLIVVIGVVIFFLSYNTYLVDHSLEDLKFALDQAARAQSITDMERIGLLLDDVLIQEVVSPRMDSLNVTNLEFTKNVVAKGGVKDQLKDVEFLLNKLIKEKEKKRGTIFITFDRMNRDIQSFIRFITKEFPAGALRQEIFKTTEKIDMSLLEKAKGYEGNWQLKEAISAYEEFINRYPSYPQLRGVKLRLADSYFKSMNYREAKRLYASLIKESPHSDEAKAADLLLVKINDKVRKRAKEKRLSQATSKLIKEGALATDYNELGLIDAYLDKLSKETKELVVYIMRGAEAIPRPVLPGIDLTMLDKAKKLEEAWMLKKAQDIYEDFVARYPTYEKIASVKLLLAGVYLKSRQYERALTAYEKVVADYPGSDEAGLGKRLITITNEIISVSQKRKYLIEKIAKLGATPELAQLYYNLGMVNIYIFDLENAENAFKKVIELVPGTELAKRAEFILGWSYKFEAKYEQGIETFSKFIEQNQEDPLVIDSTYHIADSYYKWEKFEEAAKNYEDFANRFTFSPAAQLALLQAGYTYLYNLHDPLRASEVFKKLKARYPETDVAGYISTSLGPTAERSYRDYGFILLKEGKLEEAKEAFKKAIAINREDAWAHCGLGTTYVLLILYNEGIEATAEGLKRQRDEYTHAALAFAYDEKGEYLKAIEEYKQSIAQNPNYLVSHYNLGRDCLIVGWYDLAITELKEAVKIVSNFAEGHNNLGVAYWYKGQIVDAEFEFKAAVSYKPTLVDAHYNLGILYSTSERYQKAAESFKDVLSIAPDLEQVKRRLDRIQARIRK